MNDATLRARFVNDTIATASPQRLVVLLYDRMLLDLRQASAALGAHDRNEANRLLSHAQEILLELRGSLRVDLWEGGPALAALYAYLIGELGRTIVDGDPTRVATCEQLVSPLRDAWHEAAATSGAGAPTSSLAATA